MESPNDPDPTKHVCECPEDYTGSFCEINLDPCHSRPCVYGECNRLTGDEFECQCREGFSGMFSIYTKLIIKFYIITSCLFNIKGEINLLEYLYPQQ